MLSWLVRLTPVDYAPQQSDLLSRRQEGTAQWLLDSTPFQDWVDQNIQTLFCPGIPGAGKTISAAIVVDSLSTTFRHDNVGIAYIFCNFRVQHKPVDLLTTLLQQLIRGRPSAPQCLEQLYARHQPRRTQPTIDEISKTLELIVHDHSKSFIVVDALDELHDADGWRTQLLTELFKLQAMTAVKLFFTSRPIPEIEKKFDGRCTKLEIRASPEDLLRYLDGHMWKLPSFISTNADLQKEIKTAIVQAAGGMFLLAQLYLDSLIGKRSPKAIRESLGRLRKGSKADDRANLKAYDEAYREAMERIQCQVPDSNTLAKQALSWITCAKRPLTTVEVQHALAVEVGESEFDDTNLSAIEDIISVCAGLVTVDDENKIIRLVHYTTQEFFERTQNEWFPQAQADIVDICTTYLSFEEFESGPCKEYTEFLARLRSYPLYDYAVQNWRHHFRESGDNDRWRKVHFLRSELKLEACSQALFGDFEHGMLMGRPRPGLRRLRRIQLVHLGAWFGLADVVGMLLKDGCDPDSMTSYDETTLSFTTRRGHEEVARLLIENGTKVNSANYRGMTPLMIASENGHEGIVRLLIKNGAIVISTNNFNETPLFMASQFGYERIVRILIENGAEVNPMNNAEDTPLSIASQERHMGIVRLLIENGAKVDSTNRGKTPLFSASENGHEGVARLLIENGAKVNSTDEFCETPLSITSRFGYEGVVRLLIENGAETAPSGDDLTE